VPAIRKPVSVIVAVALVLVAVGLVGALVPVAAGAPSAFKPFTSPPLAAKRLTALLNTSFATKATVCRVTNPYRIKCWTKYHGAGSIYVFHKINPYMLQSDLWAYGEHSTRLLETKVAY
jgi:hypothetical protein